MPRPSQLLLVIPCLLASAQLGKAQVLFFDNFEAGLGNWTADGLWNLEAETDTCGTLAAPFPGGGNAAYYGDDAACDFDTALYSGDLTQVASVHIPSTAQQVTLSFSSYDEAECATCDWDWRFVYVSADEGLTWELVGESDLIFIWHQVSIDLSSHAGEDIRIRLHFDAVDNWLNDYLGWLVDDVKLEASCGSSSNYCSTSPNSIGSGAVMTNGGSLSIAANSFTLGADAAAPSQPGLFYYGPNQVQAPLGDGLRCVAGSTYRLSPVTISDLSGSNTKALDFTSGVSAGGPGQILPGSTWNFQYWYRDPGGSGGSGYNLSDGLSASFCP